MNPLRNKRGNMIYYVSDNECVSSPVARIRLDVKHGELGGEITTGRGDILPITGSVMSGYEQLIITSDRFIRPVDGDALENPTPGDGSSGDYGALSLGNLAELVRGTAKLLYDRSELCLSYWRLRGCAAVNERQNTFAIEYEVKDDNRVALVRITGLPDETFATEADVRYNTDIVQTDEHGKQKYIGIANAMAKQFDRGAAEQLKEMYISAFKFGVAHGLQVIIEASCGRVSILGGASSEFDADFGEHTEARIPEQLTSDSPNAPGFKAILDKTGKYYGMPLYSLRGNDKILTFSIFGYSAFGENEAVKIVPDGDEVSVHPTAPDTCDKK